jgi:hypothetical protein
VLQLREGLPQRFDRVDVSTEACPTQLDSELSDVRTDVEDTVDTRLFQRIDDAMPEMIT